MEEKIFDISKLADSTYFADNRLPAHSDHHYYAKCSMKKCPCANL